MSTPAENYTLAQFHEYVFGFNISLILTVRVTARSVMVGSGRDTAILFYVHSIRRGYIELTGELSEGKAFLLPLLLFDFLSQGVRYHSITCYYR